MSRYSRDLCTALRDLEFAPTDDLTVRGGVKAAALPMSYGQCLSAVIRLLGRLGLLPPHFMYSHIVA